MASPKPNIGFCGLGAMGFGMATHLVSRGYNVTGYDVYAPTISRFEAAGGVGATTLSESAAKAEYYIVMVASAAQAQGALFGAGGIVEALPRGATLLLTSTVPSSYAQSVERELREVGRTDVFFIDAPVSGGAGRAADGSLSIMAGAGQEAMEKGRWLIEEMSAPSKLFVVEGGVGAGSNMKMVHQVLAAVQILAVSEAFGFGARLGLNGQDVHDAVINSEAWSWMFEHRSQRTLTEGYFPGVSAVTIILKDAGIITQMARTVAFPASMCSIAEQVYLSALDRGWGADDDAGIVRLWTSDPVSSITTELSAEEKQYRLSLVTDLLTSIHLCAAAEAISLAHHVGIPLPQLYELACDAAGGSTMFKSFGAKMISILRKEQDDSGAILEGYAEKLTRVLNEAQAIKCPLYLGNGALALMLQAGKNKDLASLLGYYTVQ